MAEQIVVVASLKDELSRPLQQVTTTVTTAGKAVSTAGGKAAASSAGWAKVSNELDKTGTRARTADPAVTKVGNAAATAGGKAAASAVGWAKLNGTIDGSMRQAVRFGTAYSKALDERTTRRFDVAALGLVATLGAGVLAARAFDSEIATLKAVASPTAYELHMLRQEALAVSQATGGIVFRAKDAARAEVELAKAGVSTADILSGGLAGALALVATEGMDVAAGTAIMSSALNMFKLKGRDATMVADTLAAGAAASSASVQGLGESLAQAGLVANSTGLNLRDTVGLLSAFAQNGMQGSDAGTSMKTMLLRLNPSSTEAAALIDKLGLSAYDSTGQFIGLTAYAGKLRGALSEMSAEQRNATLQTIFGQDAIRAAGVLYDLGAEGVERWTGAVSESGRAAQMAADQLDTLDGDVTKLGASIEANLIKGGTGANGVLRFLAQSATTASNAVGQLPEPVIGTALGVTALAGGFLLLVPRIHATKVALAEMGVTGRGALGTLRAIGPGLVATAGVTILAAATAEALAMKGQLEQTDAKLAEIRDELATPVAGQTLLSSLQNELRSAGKTAQTEYDRIAGAVDRVMSPGWDASISDVWTTFTVGLETVFTGKNPYTELQRQQAEAMKADSEYRALLGDLAFRMGITGEAAADLADDYVKQGKSLGDLSGTGYHDAAAAIQTWTDKQYAGSVALDAATAATNRQRDSVQELAATLAAAKGWTSQQEALIAYEAAVDNAAASRKKKGWQATMDIGTEKGRTNQTSLINIANAARAAYTVTDDQGVMSITDETGYRNAITQITDLADSMGYTRKEAKGYARDLMGALGKKVTEPADDAASAVDKISQATKELDGKKVTVYVDVQGRILGPVSPSLLNAFGGTGVSGGPTGDTASPKTSGAGSLARTLARHERVASALGGGYRVTNMLIDGSGLGPGSGDHRRGKAVDVVGSRLGAYVGAVRAAGGFAELHGQGSTRHAHAVLGDTASPRSTRTSIGAGGGDTVIQVPVTLVNARLTPRDIDGLTSAIEGTVRVFLRDRKERS